MQCAGWLWESDVLGGTDPPWHDHSSCVISTGAVCNWHLTACFSDWWVTPVWKKRNWPYNNELTPLFDWEHVAMHCTVHSTFILKCFYCYENIWINYPSNLGGKNLFRAPEIPLSRQFSDLRLIFYSRVQIITADSSSVTAEVCFQRKNILSRALESTESETIYNSLRFSDQTLLGTFQLRGVWW